MTLLGVLSDLVRAENVTSIWVIKRSHVLVCRKPTKRKHWSLCHQICIYKCSSHLLPCFPSFFPIASKIIQVWYIYLYIYHKNQLNVGKYTMGLSNRFIGSTVGSLPPFSQPQKFESETMTLVSLSIHSRSLT